MLREKCLVCESSEIKEVMDLGIQPFADTFISKERLGETDPAYPLICDLCEVCGQLQTRVVTDPMKRYTQHDYSYTSSNSNFSRSHWENFANEVSQKLSLKGGEFLVEIGSNDGLLTENFMKKGCRVLGVDPSPYMAKLASERNVGTIVELFGREVADKINREHGKVNLVIANNVFNHANNPLEFARAVSSMLAPGGVFVFELPYWFIGLKTEKFDQIYHEHVSYFTVKSSASLLEKSDMRIADVDVVDYHGGSIRVFAVNESDLRDHSDKAKKMILEEESYGTFKKETYDRLMGSITEKRNKFMEQVYSLKNKGIPIVGVGAAAKANTFLNFYNLDHTILDYVTDASPHKQGKYTPLTRIPIKRDDVFSDYKEVYALILSWNISDTLKGILNKINPNIKYLSLPGPSNEIEKIYSKIDPKKLLNIIYRKEHMENQSSPGVDITPEEEFLQVRSLKHPKGKVFDAHKHLPQERVTNLTQESLIIIKGAIKAKFFDVDHSHIKDTLLKEGDCLVTLNGGHGFEIDEEGTLFYEHKNGPYKGLLKDKVSI